MRQIFKNYLATFIKNWLQTLGTVLFILMMCAIVIGLLASPLQINTKINNLANNNNKYDSAWIENNESPLNSEFVYNYIINNGDYSDNGVQLISSPKGENGKIDVISPLFKNALDSMVSNEKISSNADEREKYDAYASFFNDGNYWFEQGADSKTGEYLTLTDGSGKAVDEWNKTYRSEIEDSINNFLQVYYNNGTGNGDSANVSELATRVFTRINLLLSSNGINVPVKELQEALTNNKNAGSVVANYIDNYINYGDPEGNSNSSTQKLSPNFKFYLAGFQVYSPEMAKILSNPKYNFSISNYITESTLKNINNSNAFDKEKVSAENPDGFKFETQYEHSMYLKRTTTQSLFPSFGVDLKTVNDDETNQLQLDSGSIPSKVSLNQINEIATGKIIPEIVLSSSYMAKNNLKIGDLITLPAGPEHNNVLSLGTSSSVSYDDFFTNDITFKIVGTGEKFDDAVPGKDYTPYLEDIKNYTFAYIDNNVFQFMRQAKWNNGSTATLPTSTIRVINKESNANVFNAFNGAMNNSDNGGIFSGNTGPFKPYSSSEVNSSLNNMRIRVIMFIIIGIVVLVLAFIFINFIIKKELNETRRQIGIFKSFGYKIGELSWIFAVKTAITIFVGAVLGYIISIPLQMYNATGYNGSVMFHFANIYDNPVFMVVIFIGIPLVFLIISYLLTLSYLKEPTLSLLNNGARIKNSIIKPSLFIKHLEKKDKWFNYRLQKSFVRDSYGKFIVVQVLFAIASLTFTLMFGAQTLMYSVTNQGFAVLKTNADHRFSWQNQAVGIKYGETKYNLSDFGNYEKQDFKYKSYDSKNSLKSVIKNDKNTSDSRYRINYMMSSIANTFEQNPQEAFKLLMPNDYYYASLGTPIENNPNTGKGYENQKMTYSDYYLNWILTFKINELTSQQVTESEDNKNSEMNFDSLQEFYKQNPDSKISTDSLLSGDKDKLDQFKETLFGLSDTDKNGLKNNLFLSDVTKIITLQLAESYAENKLDNYLDNHYSKNSNGKYTNDQIDTALKNVENDPVMSNFDPNNSKYWGMTNNPLININDLLSSGSSNSGSTGSSSQNGGLSLSKLSPQTISLIMTASMLGHNSKDINDMPTLTVNELFYNKDTESLYYDLPLNNVDDTQSESSYVSLHDYSTNDYGNYNENFNHSGVSDDTYKELTKDTGVANEINAIIPYGLSRNKNLKIGDVIDATSKTTNQIPIKLKVIGINRSSSVSFGTGWGIDVDYNAFRTKFFDANLNKQIDDGLPIFNDLISNEKMLQGNIDINNIASSINNLKYVGKNLSLAIKPGSSIFASIFNGMIDMAKLLNLQVDSNFSLITNPNIASNSNQSKVTPYSILRVGVNSVMDTINNVFVLFMCLEAVLLLIILVVVMNIIIEEATPVILTLKSLGYNSFEINWITMGSYISGAVISFIIAYVLSLVVWIAFLAIAGSLWHIYIFMSYSWQAPVITFLVIGAILFIGWLVSDTKVNKIPLTLVTGFN